MTSFHDRLRARFDKFRDTGREPQSPISILRDYRIPDVIRDTSPPSHINPSMYQAFEWFTPSFPHSFNSYWKQLTATIPHLRDLGISTLWLPPGCKADNPTGNGYDIYDLWDLGEFDWKMQRPTKWGSKEELMELCRVAKEGNVGVVWDAVLNHRCGADSSLSVRAVEVDPGDRTKAIAGPRLITSWIKYDFPARKGNYSQLKLGLEHFNGIDWDDKEKERSIFNFCDHDGKRRSWAKDVDDEYGNYDYLMGANLDYSNPSLRQDVLNWSLWITQELGLSGFRLDAMKHVSRSFVLELIDHVQNIHGNGFFFVGEYWKWDSKFLADICEKMQGKCSLYDTQLACSFSDYSTGKKTDLRRVLEGSLVELRPECAVTFITNHDTQPSQLLALPFEPWFLPHAYCIILLRSCPSLPCVFHGHLYGIVGPDPQRPLPCLPYLTRLRKLFAYGPQYNYWDDSRCIGWTRIGREGSSSEIKEGCVIILSLDKNRSKKKRMFVGKNNSGAVFSNVISNSHEEDVSVGEDGFGVFTVQPRSAAVWVRKEETGRLQD